MNRLRGIGVDSGSAGSHLAIWMTSSKIAYHAHQSNQPSHHVKQHIEASCLRLTHHSELYETAPTATTSQPTRDKRFRSHQEDELILNVRGVCDTTGRTGGIRKKKWVGPGKAPGPTHCIKSIAISPTTASAALGSCPVFREGKGAKAPSPCARKATVEQTSCFAS